MNSQRVKRRSPTDILALIFSRTCLRAWYFRQEQALQIDRHVDVHDADRQRDHHHVRHDDVEENGREVVVVAVEEGATLVRIGTGLFGPRPSTRKDTVG